MKSITYGEVSFEETCNFIKEHISKDLKSEYVIAVGTDSQSVGGLTKVVSVIAVIKKAKGGIFFYDINKVKKIRNLRQKIFMETECSLELAAKIMEFINKNNMRISLEVHVDIGKQGETKELIKEIVGWVMGMGFQCRMKPESYASTGIADRISKSNSKVG